LLKAQTKLTTEGSSNIGYDGADYIGGDVTITFVIQNTSSNDIVLTGLEDFKASTGPGFPLSPATFNLWYSSTSLSGSPGQVVGPIWSKISGEIPTVVNLVPGYNTIFSTLNFTIPANTTYRFALQSLNGLAFSGGLAPGYASPSIFTADSVNLVLGDAKIGGQSVGFASSFPNSSYGDSWFTGSITFHSALPCTSPPTAGIAIASVSNICSGIPFKLNDSAYSSGIGQSYQWQSSVTAGVWVDIVGDTTSKATVSQAVTTSYRLALTCSGLKAYSDSVQVTTPLGVSGVYTINSGLPTAGNNFQTFADAISYISCGINGPVVFNITPGSGPYDEQVYIPFIGGTTSINTVTINGNGETLTYNLATASNKAVITLNDADHIIIDSLTIDGTAATNYCWAILLTNKADSNIIRHCTINNNTSATALASYNGILINGSSQQTFASGNNGNNNLITGNNINGGNYGIYVYGAGAVFENAGNKITNNIVKDFYSDGIYASYIQKGLVVSGNDISRPIRINSASQCNGVNIATGCSNVLAEKNKIHNLFDALSSSTSGSSGISVTGSALVGFENKIINNEIYNINGDGIAFGIYNNTANNMQAYHNTIVLNDMGTANGAGYGFYQTGSANGIDFRNNIVSVTRSGIGTQRCIKYATNTSTILSNNNVLYINCPNSSDTGLAQFGSSNFTTLTDWKLYNNGIFDQQSVNVDPSFSLSPNNDFIPTAAATNDIGANLGVTTDLLGNSRAAFPDPGAYEFTVTGCTNAPIAGTARALISNTCPTVVFGLELMGNSLGANQTYQWQSSTNNAAPWTNIASVSPNSQLSTSQTSSNYYRCAVQCSGGTTAYSTSVQVITPSFLSGTYTINNTITTGGNNFQSFNDAINALRCGINGPVVLNVVAGTGPYTEHFTIPSITGISAINTFTINGNGATIINNSTDANNRAAIILNGADHIIIDSLTVDVSGGTYSWGIVLTNKADSNIIRKCTILSNTSLSSQNALGIFINGSSVSLATSGNNGNYNSIVNNLIVGGYYGVYLYGNSSSNTQNINNIVQGNTFKDMYSYGVYAMYQSAGLEVTSNDFSRETRTTSTSAAGVYIYTGCNGVLVEKNKIHNLFDAMPTSTQISYGIFIGSDPVAAKANKVINNLVYNMNGNGTAYGILCSFGNNCKMYHNTIVLNDSATTTGAAYGIHNPVQATGIDVRNNLIYIARTGTGTKRCLSYGSIASSINSNNNLLFTPNGSIAQIQGTTYNTLTDWQTANSNAYDQASVNADPLFADAIHNNYKPTEVTIDNIGTPLSVLTDIANIARSATTPDIGAYEFVGGGLPVSLVNFWGQKNGSINKLQWTTATEINCSGFEILYANAATNNEFAKLHYTPSAAVNGSSNKLVNYTYEDKASATLSTYYKLKQIDKDGKFTMSNTVFIKAEKASLMSIVTIYPNPASNVVNVMVVSPINSKASIIIADILGKTVSQQSVDVTTGENTILLNLSKLNAGNYTIKLSCTNGYETAIKKFVKH
jgi:trimeric autotransporter adhesin